MSNTHNTDLKPLTSGQIAEYCHVSLRAVLKWIAAGKLKAYRTPGQHSRIDVNDFISFLHTYHMPIPAQLTCYLPSKKRILIVDDDKGIVHSIQRNLMRDNKYEVDVAYDGFSAGQKFSTFRPDFIILDILMEGVNGYEICAQIRRQEANKNVKILVVSGVDTSEEIKKMMDLGADDYLAKPFTNQALQEKMKKLLGEDHEPH